MAEENSETVKIGVYEDVDIVEEEEEVKEPEEKPAAEKPSNEAFEDADEENDDVPAYEQEARAEGWRPKDEWDGNPDDWVDAKEFNFRGKLMKRIQQQSSQLNTVMKENKEVKDALRALGEHNKKIAEKEYDRALKDLKQQRLAALEDNDHHTALDLEEKMDELKQTKSELEDEAKVDVGEESNNKEGELPQEVQTWLDDDANSWYHEDPIMRAAADTVFMKYLDKNSNDVAGALDYVNETMKKRFPTEMGVQKRETKSAVTETNGRGSANKRQGGKKKFTSKDLDEEQRKVANTFVSQGVFKNVQEYVDQLADSGELG